MLFKIKFITTEDTELHRGCLLCEPLCSLWFNGSLFDSPALKKAPRHHQHTPGSAVSECAADFTLKFGGTAAELCAELAGKRSQTSVSDLEADFSHAALRGEHLPGTVHTQSSQTIMWGLAEGGAEQAMEMKFRKAGLARRLLEQNAGLIFVGKEVTSATEPTEGIVMEKVRHWRMILPLPSRRLLRCSVSHLLENSAFWR